MKPTRIPIKGPAGKDDEAGIFNHGAEFQEKSERGTDVDLVGDNPTQDPTELLAHDEDHTPNFTRGTRQPKPGYGKFEGRGSGGVGL